MSVPEQTPSNSSTGNGVTTVFPYTFKILADADVQVLVNDVEQTLGVDYTVSGAGEVSGGDVTFEEAPPNGAEVVRRRNMALARTTEYQEGGELAAATLNTDHDRAILMLQQVDAKFAPVDETTERALKVPDDEETIGDLPAVADRAGNYLGFDDNGDPVAIAAEADVALVSSFMEPVLLAADGQAARELLDCNDEPGTAIPLSGTSVDIAVPAGRNRFRILVMAASTDGTSQLALRLGDAGGIETSNYFGGPADVFNGASPAAGSNGGFILLNTASVAAGSYYYAIDFQRTTGNEWAVTWVGLAVGTGTQTRLVGFGTKTLSDTLTTVRITTFGGTDTFDAGNAYLIS